MGIEDVSYTLREAVAVSRAPPKSAAFNHKIELVAGWQNEQARGGIVCGVSGWFSLHSVRPERMFGRCRRLRWRSGRRCSAHADAINFFEQPEPVPAGPFNRIFQLTITAGNRTRELAINDPFETLELAHLITLNQRAVRDRQVLSSDMVDNVQFVALATAQLDARSATSGDDPNR